MEGNPISNDNIIVMYDSLSRDILFSSAALPEAKNKYDLNML